MPTDPRTIAAIDVVFLRPEPQPLHLLEIRRQREANTHARQIVHLARHPQPVFDWLHGGGRVSSAEMLRTFNCGIGMAVVAAATQADRISASLTENGETVVRIGEIVVTAEGQAEVRIENVSNAWGW